MDNDERYQGSRNRETWTLVLHINNDEGLYEMFRETVRTSDGAAILQDVEDRVRELLNPDEYRDTFGTDQPAALARMAFEVGSLWRVDWSEVVASLLED